MEFYGAFSDETGASAFRHRSFGAATGTVVRSRHSAQQSPQAIFELRGVSPSPREEAEGLRRTNPPPVLAQGMSIQAISELTGPGARDFLAACNAGALEFSRCHVGVMRIVTNGGKWQQKLKREGESCRDRHCPKCRSLVAQGLVRKGILGLRG
jgi:hypothetical protein